MYIKRLALPIYFIINFYFVENTINTNILTLLIVKALQTTFNLHNTCICYIPVYIDLYN